MLCNCKLGRGVFRWHQSQPGDPARARLAAQRLLGCLHPAPAPAPAANSVLAGVLLLKIFFVQLKIFCVQSSENI